MRMEMWRYRVIRSQSRTEADLFSSMLFCDKHKDGFLLVSSFHVTVTVAKQYTMYEIFKTILTQLNKYWMVI